MVADATVRNFDLNIEKILEGWETRHAIREIIANALDEQVLSGTTDVDGRNLLQKLQQPERMVDAAVG